MPVTFFQAVFSHPLLQYSLAAAFLVSLAGGVMGSFVVIKRLAFITGGIAHSVLAGIGLSVWLQNAFHIHLITPLTGALLAGVFSALLLGKVHLDYREREDSIIAAIWSVGMALGVLFLSLTPGPKIELGNYLVGNILWIGSSEILLLLGLDLFILLAVALYYHKFLTLCFDEKQARLQGLNVKRLYFLLLILIAVTVVLFIQIVGAVLVITALIIPPTIANLFTRFFPLMILLAIGLCLFFSYLGIFMAFRLDWPAGATIALVTGIAYPMALALRSKKLRVRN